MAEDKSGSGGKREREKGRGEGGRTSDGLESAVEQGVMCSAVEGRREKRRREEGREREGRGSGVEVYSSFLHASKYKECMRQCVSPNPATEGKMEGRRGKEKTLAQNREEGRGGGK